jgi:hypothetical protein
MHYIYNNNVFEIELKSHPLTNLKDDDYKVVIKLFFMASTIKYEVLGVLESFLSFLRKYGTRKTHVTCF